MSIGKLLNETRTPADVALAESKRANVFGDDGVDLALLGGREQEFIHQLDRFYRGDVQGFAAEIRVNCQRGLRTQPNDAIFFCAALAVAANYLR